VKYPTTDSLTTEFVPYFLSMNTANGQMARLSNGVKVI